MTDTTQPPKAVRCELCVGPLSNAPSPPQQDGSGLMEAIEREADRWETDERTSYPDNEVIDSFDKLRRVIEARATTPKASDHAPARAESVTQTVEADDTPANVERMDERGFVTWASSEEGGGPDVGITVGLGAGLGHLWLGEITRQRWEDVGGAEFSDNDYGHWLIHYAPGKEPEVLAKALQPDHDPLRDFLEHTIAPLLKMSPPQPDRNTGEVKYLVWSHEHGAWWRPDRCGYTIHEAKAGRYSKDEALSICKNARDGWPSNSKTAPSEIPVRESDIAALTSSTPTQTEEEA